MAGPAPLVVGVGVACLDYLFVAPPVASGGYAPLRAYLVQGGGLVGSALVAAARLGARAQIWTWVGDDPVGEQVLTGLRDEGVDTTHAEVVPGVRTPVSFIQVEERTGERTIFYSDWFEVPEPLVARACDRSLSCDALLVDSLWPAAGRAAAEQARRAGRPVVSDFCPRPELAELTRLVTALVVPRGCADHLAPGLPRDQQLGRLRELGPELVAITAGEEGCDYLAGDALGRQPAFSVPVVDTTGAGDVFHGAIAYALARGWPAAQAVEFASAAAALSCRALGGRTAAPTLDETLALLRTRGSPAWRSE